MNCHNKIHRSDVIWIHYLKYIGYTDDVQTDTNTNMNRRCFLFFLCLKNSQNIWLN